MDFVELYRYLLVPLGIGLVIFVHEAGHFIAARLCKVRVEVFSLGFGPRLLAWKRGQTVYQIALVPLGGYVKMAGEESFGAERHAPDDLMAKTVGQRFLIYSGGVLMNVLFGLVVFPIILMYGVPFPSPVIGDAIPGGPAWQAEIPAGSRVLAINGQRAISFDSILQDVALSPGEGVRLELLEPGASEPRAVVVQPVYNEDYGVNMIDVEPAADPSGRLIVTHDVARRAGIESDDRLIAVRDGVPEFSLAMQLRRAMQSEETIGLTLMRGDRTFEVELAPQHEVPARAEPLLGIQRATQRVSGLRANPDAQALGLLIDDCVVAVNGLGVAKVGDFRRGLLAQDPEAPLRVRVRRGARMVELSAPALTRERALALVADVALSMDNRSTVVAVTPRGPAAAAGLVDGDRVMRIAGTSVDDWGQILELAQSHAGKGEVVSVEVERLDASGPQRVPTLSVLPAPLERPNYGILLAPAVHVYQASGPAEAVAIGLSSTWKFTQDAWNTLKGIVLGQVSTKVLGSIITIGAVSYSWASVGLAKLFFFLCILSLNLAFLNVLPIPVLDGGHLFFLLIEKLKGSPVSERVLGYSQMVGLVLIVSLMIYVTWIDIQRWFL